MRTTLSTLHKMTQDGDKITMLTCYDASFAALLESAGVETLLIGDSLGNVLQGHETTLPVTLRDIVYHTACVARGAKRAFIIGDMPFGSYQGSQQQAFENAARMMAAGAHMIKLEGGALMAETVLPLAEDILDRYSLAGRKVVLDVGGGEGAFLAEVAWRYHDLQLKLFDLPAVIEGAKTRLARLGLVGRVELSGGNFHQDPLPVGADVITLVRILLDHDDESVLRLLHKVKQALQPGGVLLIVEPFSGVRGAETVGDVYFGLYLRAMGRGRARRADELQALLRRAGFQQSRVHRTRYPVYAGLITATH